jgi:hypothetical protein
MQTSFMDKPQKNNAAAIRPTILLFIHKTPKRGDHTYVYYIKHSSLYKT